jgi:hypothetical protein
MHSNALSPDDSTSLTCLTYITVCLKLRRLIHVNLLRALVFSVLAYPPFQAARNHSTTGMRQTYGMRRFGQDFRDAVLFYGCPNVPCFKLCLLSRFPPVFVFRKLSVSLFLFADPVGRGETYPAT